MIFKVTVLDEVVYEVEAATRDEAIKSVIYGPMYDTAKSINKTDDKHKVDCEKVN